MSKDPDSTLSPETTENDVNNNSTKVVNEAEEIELDDGEPEETNYQTPGKSVLPIAKVKRILKLDSNYTPTSEATVFMIAKSTELFIQHFTMKAQANANMDKRKKIQYKDFSGAVNSNQDLQFLKGLVPETVSVRKLAKTDKIKYSKTTTSIKNLIKKKTIEEEEKEEGNDKKEENKNPVLEKGQRTLDFKFLQKTDKEILNELVDSEPEFSENENNDEPIKIDEDNE